MEHRKWDFLEICRKFLPKNRRTSAPQLRSQTFPPSAMTLTQHRPLGLPKLPNSRSIRILQLEPGSSDDRLMGTFEVVDINEAGSYEPVSYVWAQEEPAPKSLETITIRQDSKEWTVKLTRNLHGALKQFRLRDNRRRLWVDQICIDQGSEERSEQVQLMNQIYQNADHVLAWLGLDPDELAKSAFELIYRLDEALKYRETLDFSAAYNEELEILIEKDKKALDQLTSLPWFKRGWIVQEIGTKAPATMMWGDSSIDWEILHRVCDNLTVFHHLRSRLNIRTSDIKYMYRRFVDPDPASYHANRFNFIYELHRARGLAFSDHRDRIFAWLGHYSVKKPNELLAALEPNYDTHVEDLYFDVARRALLGKNDEKTGSALIALAAVQHVGSPGSVAVNGLTPAETHETQRSSLPSWVPDWRVYQSFLLSEPVNSHRAHGTTIPKLDIDIESRILRIHGIMFDHVIKCSQPLEAKAFHPARADKMTKPVIDGLWQDFCEQSRYSLDAKYPNGDELLFAFMQTLSNGSVQIAAREGKAYHDIPATRWLEQHAVYLHQNIADASNLDESLLQLAQTSTKNGIVEQWSRAANGASKNRIFAITSKGYLALLPRIAQVGDVICVLYGGKAPFCLRNLGNQYLLIGECYVHGLMNGEAISMARNSRLTSSMFEIS